MQLFVDLDGVLADFDTGYEKEFGIRPNIEADNVDWRLVRGRKDFYRDLPPMPDMEELWAFISPFKPIILTGIPASVSEAADNKRAWVERILPGTTVICCRSREKYQFCHSGDVLVDDWERYKSLWLEAGGLWITHTSAKQTIDELTTILL